MTKLSSFPVGVLLLLLLLVGLLLRWLISRASPSTSKAGTFNDAESNYSDIVYRTLQNGGYPKSAHYWVGVARHETDGYTSPLFMSARNTFGMMQPRKRPTTSLGPVIASEGSFASFDSVKSATEDLLLWLKYNNFPDVAGGDQNDLNGLRTLVDAMKAKGYFTDSVDNYYNGVKRQLGL